MASKIHDLDIPAEFTTVSGTASGDLTVLSAIGDDWAYRILGAWVSNDAGNTNAVNLQPETTAEPRLMKAIPANDSTEFDLLGRVWELPENEGLVAHIDDTPTPPGQVAVTVAYYKRHLK